MRSSSFCLAPALLLAGLLSAGCRSDPGARADDSKAATAATPAATTTAAEKPDDVVASVDGVPITRKELDERAAASLRKVREQEYEARKQALEGLVLERLFDREAKARGISREQLLKDEIEAKVPQPTPAQVAELYNQNRHRVGARTLEQLTPEIEKAVRQRAEAERAQAFERDLRSKVKVAVALTQPRNEVPFPADAQVFGPKDAPVTIVEYSDYLCPYCQTAQVTVDEVLARNKGKVRFVHRDYLLGRPRSLAVARAALCAGDQGKFWEFRSSLMHKPSNDWSDTYLNGTAAGLKLDTAAFSACLASTKHDASIQGSSKEGAELGVDATPTFFVNGRRLMGARDPGAFQEVIDAELAKQS